METGDGLAPAGIAFAQALRAAGDPRVTEQHMATDHSFSDHGIALETSVLTSFATLEPAVASKPGPA